MTKPRRPTGILRNLLSYWFSFIFVAVVGFFLSPFVVKHLGNTAYGVWTLLVALVGYLGLLDFGVRGAVTRYVAHHHAVGDNTGCSSIVSAGLSMFGMLGTAAIILACTFAYFAPQIFNIPASHAEDTRIVLALGGLTMAVTLIGAVFGGVIAGLERFDISSGIEIIVTALRTTAIVIALSEGYGLVTLSLIHLASSVTNGLVAWIAVRKLYPELRLDFRQPLLPHMRTILTFSIFLSAIHVLGALIYYTDSLVIALFLPVSSVTFFAIAGNLCDYARQAAAALSMLMAPRVSALSSSGSDKVGAEILGAARIATLITAPIAMTFFFRGESFINLWMGMEYGRTSGEILSILAFVVLLGGARNVATSSIIGVNQHRTLIPVFAFEAVCNLALSVTLVQLLGLKGVAIGTLLPSLIVSLGLIPRCLNRAAGVPIKHYYVRAWLLPIVATLPFALASALIDQYWPANNLAMFFAQIAVVLPLVVIAAAAVCLDAQERIALSAAIKKQLSNLF